MSSLLSELGQSAANLPAEAVAFALGIAAGRALEAPGTEIGQKTWAALPIKAVDPGTAAEIVAEGVDQLAWGEGEAEQSGINKERFDLMVQEVLDSPGFGDLLRMMRRGTINGDDLTHGFRKLKLETRWDSALTDLQIERLDPAVIAVSGQRGTMDDAGLLPVGPPTEVGKVPPMPKSSIDTLKEAAASGIDSERLAVMMRNVGLPPGPGELLQLLNRGDIELADFYRGVSEGNIRNEWGPVLLGLRRRLLSPHEYEEAALRGVITQAEADAGAALSGMEADDAQLLFNILGRPLAVHAITTGLARGGTYGGTYDDVPEPYRDAIRRSNIRPEYAVLAHANRYAYPSAFVLRALAQAGELTHDETLQILLDIGWEPTLAAKVSATWTTTTTAAADKHVTSAQGKLVTAVHKSYVNDKVDEATARTDLTAGGLTTAEQDTVLELWNRERELVRKDLTASAIRKAVGLKIFTTAEAQTRLEAQGMSPADAVTYLNEA